MFNYFCHPTSLSSMDDVLKMRMSEGAAGYGLYVLILEQLRNSETLSINLDLNTLAWSLHEPDTERLRRVIQNYGLFEITPDNTMYSPWLSGVMAEHEQRRAKLSAAGKKSAALRQQGSNQVATTLTAAPQPPCNEVAKNSQQKNKEKEINKKINTPPSTYEEGEEVDIFSDDYISRIGKAQFDLFDPERHAVGLVSDAQHNYNVLIAAALQYQLTVRQFVVLNKAVDGCTIGAPRFMAFIAALRHCKDTNFKPNFPFEYFMSQLKRVAV